MFLRSIFNSFWHRRIQYSPRKLLCIHPYPIFCMFPHHDNRVYNPAARPSMGYQPGTQTISVLVPSWKISANSVLLACRSVQTINRCGYGYRRRELRRDHREQHFPRLRVPVLQDWVLGLPRSVVTNRPGVSWICYWACHGKQSSRPR